MSVHAGVFRKREKEREKEKLINVLIFRRSIFSYFTLKWMKTFTHIY